MRKDALLLISACSFIAVAAASAEPFTVTEMTTVNGIRFTGGPGHIVRIDYTGVPTVLTLTGDTSTIRVLSDGAYAAPGAFSFSAPGLVTYSVPYDPYSDYPYYTYVNRGYAGIGHSGGRPDGGGNLTFSVESDDFTNYDLMSDFGPSTGITRFALRDYFPFVSFDYKDSVQLDSFGPTTTYQVTVGTAPEPSSLLLLGTGFIGMIGIARRKYVAR